MIIIFYLTFMIGHNFILFASVLVNEILILNSPV